MDTKLTATALVCSLNPSPTKSSSEHLARQVAAELQKHDVECTVLRVADYTIAPGVQIDMGEGDQWPQIREQVMQSDILLIATPIWLGHPSSIAQRVLERLDAELSESDDEGRLLTYGKVGIVAVVGNEDGAHKVAADLFQGLNDIGFTIPSIGSTYWVGEAMNKKDYMELDNVPPQVASTTKSLAANAAHLAALLARHPYPPA